MRSARIYPIAHSQLPNSPQTLEIRMLNNIIQQFRRNGQKSVQRVIDDLIFIHFLQRYYNIKFFFDLCKVAQSRHFLSLKPFFWGCLLSFTLLCPSCKQDQEITSEKRTLSEFSNLKISQNFILEVINDTSQPPFAEITYYSHRLQHIQTNIEDGWLNITDNYKAKWRNDPSGRPKVKVNVHQLWAFVIDGSAEVFTQDTLQGDRLELHHSSVRDCQLNLDYNTVSGSCQNFGSMTLSGRATIMSWFCERATALYAANLINDDLYFWHYTVKDCYVHPQKVLNAYLFNSGNLHLSDTSNFRLINIQTSGTGKLITSP
jgi:hypothetical protein